MINKDINIQIVGLGFALYSDNLKDIEKGKDFFTEEFLEPEHIISHLEKGDIIGFCTGSAGDYNIKFRQGLPTENIKNSYPFSTQLVINVLGGKISIVDVYWLMEWASDCPENQQIIIEDGIYLVNVLTKKPKSNIWGNNQEIYIFLQKVDKPPKIHYNGIPYICD